MGQRTPLQEGISSLAPCLGAVVSIWLEQRLFTIDSGALSVKVPDSEEFPVEAQWAQSVLVEQA